MSVGTDTGFATYRGRKPWAWVKRLLNPWNHLKLLARIKATYPRRLRVLLMTLPLQFHPQSLYRFSAKELFPEKNRRLVKTPNPLDDFVIDWDRTSKMPPLGHVTVIQKGLSFERSMVDELPGPIYAVNWRDRLDRQDVVYVTGDHGYVKRFVQAGMFPILFLDIMEISEFDDLGYYHARHRGDETETFLEDPRIQRVALYHKAGPQRPRTCMPATSGLACLVALNFLAQSIEAYGWDFYLDFSPGRAGYWRSFFGCFVNFRMERQSQFIENAIYNWHYAYRFSQLPNFVNHGYLSGLEMHPGINQRLDKIFYNA